MPTFSSTSQAKLRTCHPDIQMIFNAVIQYYDCTILYGLRTFEEQKRLVNEGKSKTMNSKHLEKPDGYSHAVDVSPYPIPDEWGDHNPLEKAKFYHFAGYVKAKAEELGVNIRWGGDWDGDLDFDDQTFFDLVHFELA